MSVWHWALLGAFVPLGKPHVTVPSYRAVASPLSCGVGPLLGPAEVQVGAGQKFKAPAQILPGWCFLPMFVMLWLFLSKRSVVQTQFLKLLKYMAKLALTAGKPGRPYLAELRHCCSPSKPSNLQTKCINHNDFDFVLPFADSLQAVFNLGL